MFSIEAVGSKKMGHRNKIMGGDDGNLNNIDGGQQIGRLYFRVHFRSIQGTNLACNLSAFFTEFRPVEVWEYALFTLHLP